MDFLAFLICSFLRDIVFVHSVGIFFCEILFLHAFLWLFFCNRWVSTNFGIFGKDNSIMVNFVIWHASKSLLVCSFSFLFINLACQLESVGLLFLFFSFCKGLLCKLRIWQVFQLSNAVYLKTLSIKQKFNCNHSKKCKLAFLLLKNDYWWKSTN